MIFDSSWSVAGGNDVLGRRYELALIAIEHLAAVDGHGHWYVWLTAFDSPSVLDLPTLQLNQRGLNQVRDVLLRENPGGSSVLGPSLERAELAASQFSGSRRVLVCLTDFELYDSDPISVIQRLATFPATEVLALSLRNDPPSLLARSGVSCAQVLPTDDPAQLANYVIEAAHACTNVQ